MEIQHPPVVQTAAHIRETYGVEPEFLWAKTPNNAVFRHPDNKKWFAVLLMAIQKNKLGLAGEGSIDILDLKCPPQLVTSLQSDGRCLPGYHMNKEHWIGVPLDGRLPPEELFTLISMSYDITKAKR